MSTVLSVSETIESIKEQAERICSDKTQRFPEAASFGDAWRQGDVYITLLESVPDPYYINSEPELQLAPGTSQGSRHCLDSLDGVTMYVKKSPGMLDGPVFEVAEERTVEHPEHGNVILPPGIYGISYQRNLDAEDRERRVQD